MQKICNYKVADRICNNMIVVFILFTLACSMKYITENTVKINQ